jgi:hypothetical protein
MHKLLFCLFACGLPASDAQTLAGVIDTHAHCDPDSMARSIDGIALAKLAQARGLRGVVLKNHFESTAGMAWLARQQVPGIEVFGGIALNRPVGGINPAAVDQMARLKGGCGRIVWMPTFDAENQVRSSKESRPFVSISRNGRLLPEVNEVLTLMARYKLALATGHSSAQENLLLIREAKARGVQRIVVTHPISPPVEMTLAQMKEAAQLGAFIEFCYNSLLGANQASVARAYAAAIRGVGPEHCILSSDLGQAGNPLHPDGLVAYFRILREQGFSAGEIERMAKVNPARLLGLPEAGPAASKQSGGATRTQR